MPSSEKLVYKSGAGAAGGDSAISGLRKNIQSVRGSLRALPPGRTRSPLKKSGRTVNKIRARAIKVKKQADAKKAAKVAASAKLKALKAKIKEEPKDPSPKSTSKVAAKVAEKSSSSTNTPKAVNQKIIVKVVTVPKAAKSNKSLSPSAVSTKKKAAVAAVGQPKPKKQSSPSEKPETSSSSGIKSPQGVTSAAGAAQKPAAAPPQEKTKQPQPKLTQDKNLNIIERRTAKEVKNGERKKSGSAEEKQRGARSTSRDKSASPSSKSSSKCSSPLPMPTTSNPLPTSPSSLSKYSGKKASFMCESLVVTFLYFSFCFLFL